MIHVFLTGCIQVGKSTVINRVVDELKSENPHLKIRGFKTISGPLDENGWDSIHIVRADGTEKVSESNCTFRRGWIDGQRVYESKKNVFDEYGARLLDDESLSGADLILMDEIGLREANSTLFYASIMKALYGDTPILGVVQKREGGFLDNIRNHPKVKLIEVDEENRDEMPEKVLELLR